MVLSWSSSNVPYIYGLPESGKLWHELLKEKLKSVGYVQVDGDSCIWRYVAKTILCIYTRVHKVGNQLWTDCTKNYANKGFCHLPATSSPTPTPSPSSGSTSSSYQAAVYSCPNSVISRPSSTRTSTNGSRIPSCRPTTIRAKYQVKNKNYMKELMRIAWASRTRPDILAAVSHRQNRYASPRQIDLDDLGYMIGYLANTPSQGIVIDCKELQLYLYVDVGHATHEDKKSQSSGIASCGRSSASP